MIWVLLLIFFVIGVLGYAICSVSIDYEGVGGGVSIFGFTFSIITFFVAIWLLVSCVETAKIDEKIKMYETENDKIEQQLMVIIQNYQKYEQEIFGEVTKKNVVSFITLFPELRSDSLVEKQMSVYYSNHEKITSLKEKQIMASLYRWWVYFGK